jgi:hypothetical protein
VSLSDAEERRTRIAMNSEKTYAVKTIVKTMSRRDYEDLLRWQDDGGPAVGLDDYLVITDNDDTSVSSGSVRDCNLVATTKDLIIVTV